MSIVPDRGTGRMRVIIINRYLTDAAYRASLTPDEVARAGDALTGGWRERLLAELAVTP